MLLIAFDYIFAGGKIKDTDINFFKKMETQRIEQEPTPEELPEKEPQENPAGQHQESAEGVYATVLPDVPKKPSMELEQKPSGAELDPGEVRPVAGAVLGYGGIETSREIREIDRRIKNIEAVRIQDLPWGVPSSIERGRQESIEKLKEERKAKIKEMEQNKEHAFGLLADPEIINKKTKEIAEIFRNATEDENGHHRNLVEERNKMVKENLESRGMMIVQGKDIEQYRQQAVQREQEAVLWQERSKAINTFWERNSGIKPEAREAYLNKVKKRLGLEPGEGDVIFDRLVNDGYEVEKAKMGWLSSKMKMPKLRGKLVTVGEKDDLFREASQRAKAEALANAQTRVDLRIIEGQKKLSAERSVCVKKIIGQTVEVHSLEKQQNKEAEQQARFEQQKGEREEAEKEQGEKRKKEKYKKRKKAKKGQPRIFARRKLKRRK